ncbi:hypothetical protein HK096_007791, partial [Nowakowskiella sp. JEL0078]
MASKDELLAWVDGLDAYKKGDFKRSLEFFNEVAEYSKIQFNMGMIFIRLKKFDRALEMFSNSLQIDMYFALAYFQRDYSQALELLLDNDNIDYEILGLKHKLYRCEVHFNRGVTLQQINEDAYDDLESARKNSRTPEQRSIIERIARDDGDITLFTVPITGLFQVREEKLKNLEKKNFMKEAKIVMAVDNDDDYIGFSGAQILTGNGGTLMRKASQNGTLSRRATSSKSLMRKDSQQRTNDSRLFDDPPINILRSESASRPRIRSDEEILLERTLQPFSNSNQAISPEKLLPPKMNETLDRDFGSKSDYGNTISRKSSKSRMDMPRQSSLVNRGGPGTLYSRNMSPVGRAKSPLYASEQKQSENRDEFPVETPTIRREPTATSKDK